MKSIFKVSTLFMAILLYSCGNVQSQNTKTVLSVTEFSERINTNTSAVIIDVRTPAEFSQGHLENAINIDWNGNDFEKQISTLDKTKPVYVYCKSGARSAAAAKKMRDSGFKEVYELEGGILKWIAAKLPTTVAKN